MNKRTTDLTWDELAKASEILDDKTRTADIETASTHELLELIRLQHVLRTDLRTAVAALRAAHSRCLH